MTSHDISLLKSIPELKTIIGDAQSGGDLLRLPRAQREQIIDVLQDEFTAIGLGPNDEPNQVGLQIERVIDELSSGIWE